MNHIRECCNVVCNVINVGSLQVSTEHYINVQTATTYNALARLTKHTSLKINKPCARELFKLVGNWHVV